MSDRAEQPVRREPLLLQSPATSAELGGAKPLEPAASRGAERVVRGNQRDVPAGGELLELRPSPRRENDAGHVCRPLPLRTPRARRGNRAHGTTPYSPGWGYSGSSATSASGIDSSPVSEGARTRHALAASGHERVCRFRGEPRRPRPVGDGQDLIERHARRVLDHHLPPCRHRWWQRPSSRASGMVRNRASANYRGKAKAARRRPCRATEELYALAATPPCFSPRCMKANAVFGLSSAPPIARISKPMPARSSAIPMTTPKSAIWVAK